MANEQLGLVEKHFADIIWDNEPISSTNLVKLAREKLQWKKSTTYTVLKRLCEKGFFKNEGGAVTSLVSRDEYLSSISYKFVNDTFHGSLPSFVAAFSAIQQISDKEWEEIRKMIEEKDD
jgi:predicted transcriptional regulator